MTSFGIVITKTSQQAQWNTSTGSYFEETFLFIPDVVNTLQTIEKAREKFSIKKKSILYQVATRLRANQLAPGFS